MNIKKTYFNKKKQLRSRKILNNYKYSEVVVVIEESGVITKSQYESFRKVIARGHKSTIKVWFPSISILPTSKKTAGHRMGKGVGEFDKLVYPIKKGSTVVEVTIMKGSNKPSLRILCSALKKLPLKTKILYRSKKNLSL